MFQPSKLKSVSDSITLRVIYKLVRLIDYWMINPTTLATESDGAAISDFVSDAVDRWASDGSKEDAVETVESYRKYLSRKIVFIVACVLISLVVVGYSISVGAYGIGFFESYDIIWNHFFGEVGDGIKDSIIFEMRLPRIVTGLIAGAGLAICGAAMQSILMNPLADSYTTGVSAGAGFGATVAIVANIQLISGQYGTVLNACVFSLIPTFAMIVIGRVRNASPTVLIMAGIAVMYIFSAASTLLQLWADPSSLQAVYRWTVGSLANAGWDAIPVMFVVTLAGSVVLMLLSGKINVLASGDEFAKTMGIDADRLRMILMVLIALITATIVSFTGLIGFVGLVCPHIVRLFVGSDNRFLLPGSAFFGASLLVLADLFGRTVISPAILQVGVVTAFLGGPVLILLLLRRNGQVV